MIRSLFSIGSVLVALWCASSAVAAQQSSLTGNVMDVETGQPISAAQVYVPALDIGGLSGVNGRYQLANVPPGEHTVRVERLGYRTVEQTATIGAGQTLDLNFEMSRQAISLDEIVVTGTAGGTQRRAIGNVVERMDMTALTEVASVNFEEAIGTRVPGVIMQVGSGTAGGGGKIRIRGSSSLSIAGDPLIYIDGIRMDTDPTIAQRDESVGRLNDINPEDIESIEILKGPAASTLYGTEASNGVIQITTKRGTEGPAVFTVSAEYGQSWMPNVADRMTPVCYFPESRGDPIPSDALTTGWLEEVPNQGTLFCYTFDKSVPRAEYWGQPLFQSGQIQKYNVNVQGGTSNFRYLASINRSDVDGVTYRDWDERTTGRLNLFFSALDETLSFSVSASVLSALTRNPTNVWRNMTSSRSVNYNGPTGGLRDFAWEAAVKGRENMISLDRSTWSVTMNHSPNTWLTNRVVFGVDRGNHREDQITFKDPEGVEYVGPQFGRRGRDGEKTIDMRVSPITTLDIGSSVTIPLISQLTGITSVGLQYYNQTSRRYEVDGSHFATRALTTVGAAAVTEADESFLETTSLGVYVQEQFDWDNRLFLTAAVRADDSSAFGSDFDVATYPKVSATWVLSEEPFWSTDFVSSMRLRGAWGASGQQPDFFAGQTLYSTVTAEGGKPAFSPTGLGNADLGPERGEEIEVGFDMGLWDERAQLQFTYYTRTTKDAIVARPVLESRGYPGTQLLNIGQIDAWGTETALNLQVLNQDPIWWDLNIAFATMGNEIVDMGGQSVLPVGRSRSQRHLQGFPVAGFHDVKVTYAEFKSGDYGPINTDTWLCDGGAGPNKQMMGGPDVPCGEAGRVYYGQPEPSFTFNVSSSMTLFENWQIFSSFDLRGGNMRSFDLLGALHNRSSRAIQVQDDPIFMAYSLLSRSPNVHHDNGFARWRELSLRYELPTSLAARLLGAQRASILVGMHNVALLWWQESQTAHGCSSANLAARDQSTARVDVDTNCGLKAVDPEFNTAGFDIQGETQGGMPPISDLTVRLNVTF